MAGADRDHEGEGRERPHGAARQRGHVVDHLGAIVYSRQHPLEPLVSYAWHSHARSLVRISMSWAKLVQGA